MEENLHMEMFQQDRSRRGDLCHGAALCFMLHQKYWPFLTTYYTCGYHNAHIVRAQTGKNKHYGIYRIGNLFYELNVVQSWAKMGK